MAEAQSTLWDTGDPVKRCCICGVVKPFKDFGIINSSYGRKKRRGGCRQCLKERQRQFHKRHGKKKARQYNIGGHLSVYGLTIKDYDKMFAVQSGLCAI